MNNFKFSDVLPWIALLLALYFSIAVAIFEYRNPKANRMSIIRDFMSIVQFEKLEKYQ